MKAKCVFITSLIVCVLLFSSCEDNTNDLLTDLAPGTMIYIINDQEPAYFNDCNWSNYGQDLKGQIAIKGSDETGRNNIYIYIGEDGNQNKLSVRSYSTAFANDKTIVFTSFGSSDVDANVTVDITKITDTEISGRFNGKVSMGNSQPVRIRGAFRALSSI